MIWHSAPLENVIQELHTDGEKGLSAEKAAERIRHYGENTFAEKKRHSVKKDIINRILSPWSVVLIIAAILSFLVTIFVSGHTFTEPILILIIFSLNIALGSFLKFKADKALAKTDVTIQSTVSILRHEAVVQIRSDALVPGDIVLINQGDLIPADGRLIESNGLSCDESSLSGDTAPITKDYAILPEDIAPIEQRYNMVFMGCTVLHGSAKFVVTDTGLSTELGKQISLARQAESNEIPLKQYAEGIGKMAGRIAVIAGILLFLLTFIFGGVTAGKTFVEDLAQCITLACAFVVAVMPESIGVVFSITLALGIIRMIKSNAVLKKISKLEDLAAVSVICSDKTGTLTKNNMKMVSVFDGTDSVTLSSEEPTENMKTLIQMGALCCETSAEMNPNGKLTFTGDPTEASIEQAGIIYCNMNRAQLEQIYPRMYTIPFDTERQLMTSINMINNRPYAIVKGSPDKLLPKCIGDNQKAAKWLEQTAQTGLRVIAVGVKILDELPANPTAETMECDLNLLGLFGIGDTVRNHTVEALNICREANIQTVMMTGDNLMAATAIGEQLGILGDGKIAVTGEKIAEMQDFALKKNVGYIGVYSRLSGEDRARIMESFKQNGDTVAITGDEVRDAQALSVANIGFAMCKKGTDAAKSSADVLLTNDSFADAVKAIRESRVIVNNLRRAILYLFSSNLGELLLMLLGVLIFRLPPLTAVQLLWINLITDCIPAISLGGLRYDNYTMKQPVPTKNHYFSGRFVLGILIHGLLIAGASVISYGIGAKVSATVAATMAFTTVGLAQLLLVPSVLSAEPLYKLRTKFSKITILSWFAAVLLIMLIALTPLCTLLGGAQIQGGLALSAIGLSLIVPAVTEAVKLILYLSKSKKK